MLKNFSAVDQIPDARYVTIPTTAALTDQPRERREATGYHTIRLPEHRVFQIVKRPLVVVIGGPPNSGKSTVAASLMVEVNAILDSLQSRGGIWEQLGYRCSVETLDAATPVSDAVVAGVGKSKSMLKERKVPWSKSLAFEAVKRVCDSTKGSPQLVLADLPGRIDDLTRILTGSADAALVVTNCWERIEEWRSMFRQHDVPVLGEFESVITPSMITRLDRGKIIRGRIHKPDRIVNNWDPTIRTLAEFLLFELLPAKFGKPLPAP